jgi:hypothetical protein
VVVHGEQHDATGLEYLRARYYDASTGRFLSRCRCWGLWCGGCSTGGASRARKGLTVRSGAVAWKVEAGSGSGGGGDEGGGCGGGEAVGVEGEVVLDGEFVLQAVDAIEVAAVELADLLGGGAVAAAGV